MKTLGLASRRMQPLQRLNRILHLIQKDSTSTLRSYISNLLISPVVLVEKGKSVLHFKEHESTFITGGTL